MNIFEALNCVDFFNLNDLRIRLNDKEFEEYVKLNCKSKKIQEDKFGNIYINYLDNNIYYNRLHYIFDEGSFLDNFVIEYKKDNFGYIPAEQASKLKKEFNISVDGDIKNWESFSRRPYYRLRGKKVTKGQAFEVIRRTDFFWLSPDNEDHVYLLHFKNWWLDKGHYPQQMGWIRPSGIVGGNGITDKYPSIGEILADIIYIKFNFPYLDFVVAISDINEGVIEEINENDWTYLTLDDDDEAFIKSIDIGVLVLGNEIKFLNSKNAVKIYFKYALLYEDKNKEIYKDNYYEKTGISEIDDEFIEKYFAKCIPDLEKRKKAIEKYYNYRKRYL